MSRVSAFIDAQPGRVGAFLIMGPLALSFPPLTGCINPVWSSLLGFPGHLAARGHHVYGSHPWYEGWAVLGWPVLVFAAMIWTSLRLVLSRHRFREAAVLIWAASAFFLFPLPLALKWFGDWPLWMLV